MQTRLALTLGLCLAMPALPVNAQVFDRLPEVEPIETELFDSTIPEMGPLANPAPTAAGLYLFIEMTRHVCLGVEAGIALEDLAFDGFQTVGPMEYRIGWERNDEPMTVLSASGDLEEDGENGHPVFDIRTQDEVTCRTQWFIVDALDDQTRAEMAALLRLRLPQVLQLIPVRGHRVPLQINAAGGLDTYLRACAGAWCETTAISFLGESPRSITISMTLNPEGPRP